MSRVLNKLRRIEESLLDRRYGIDSSEFHTQYDAANPDFRGYAPTTYRDWRVIREHIKNTGGTFIDYGCGLGRVAILASREVFGSVIGLDIDPELIRRGNENLAQARGRGSAPIKLLCADATTYTPPSDTSVAYFCNPFAGAVLAGTLDQLRGHEKYPHALQLVCNLPDKGSFETEISEVGWLRLKANFPLSDNRKCLIFVPTH